MIKLSSKSNKSKKIIILATAIGPTNRGIGQYEHQLLPHLLPRLIAQGYQTLVILSKDANLPFFQEGFNYLRLPVERNKSFFRFLAEQLYTPYFSFGADIFLSLESVFPLFPIRAKRKLVVVHDIHVLQHLANPEQYPEDYTWQLKVWANLATRKAIRTSEKIITPSRFTAEEIQSLLGIPLDRIITIPNGIDRSRFHPIKNLAVIEQVRKRYFLPSSFYLFVGPYSRKKNLQLIVKAYALAKLDSDIFLPVVVVGDTRRNRLYGETLSLIKKNHLTKFFQFLGFVPDEDLPVLYTLARAFLYPSLHEGFGLAAVEAMACATPVIASNQASIPEVVGDAGILIDPTKPEFLIDALDKVNDESIRKNLIEKGLERAKMFSWEKTAQLMEKAILE